MLDLLRASVDTDRALVARGGLYDFVSMAWPLVEPSTFVGNWHLKEECNHLEATSRGEITRLLINQPPGTGKSTTINVFWPVWDWLRITGGKSKWIFASYDASLVGTRDGGKVIKLMGSDWFKARWGDLLEPGKAAASNFNTRAGGFRFSTSPGGGATGRHSDFQVIDDPIKPKDALGGATVSKNAIRAVSDWFKSTMSTRATDQRTFRKVIVMQRLTHDDLAGELLLSGEWVHLRFPMRYEADWPCVTRWGRDIRTKPGELLFPERFPLDVVDRLEATELGPVPFAAQCQQRPQVQGGGTFKRDWFRFWHVIPGIPEPCMCEQCYTLERTLAGHQGPRNCAALPEQGLELQSWDLAFKGIDSSDFVAGQTFRVAGGSYYLIDSDNRRLSYPETRVAIRDMSQRRPRAYDKLVEDKANGPAIADDLKQEIPGITLVTPSGGKEARANSSSTLFSEGRVYVPHPSLVPWVYAYLKQLEAFPRGSFDDMVDATTQALVRLKSHGSNFSQAMAKLRGER